MTGLSVALSPLRAGRRLPAELSASLRGGAHAFRPDLCRRVYLTGFVWCALVDCLCSSVQGKNLLVPEPHALYSWLLFCVHR